uniref:Alpha-(1,6)-fucosyltransferase n=1 Tax=Hydra vulgaris TaxID=6087 RepID=T2M5J3_HYDVU
MAAKIMRYIGFVTVLWLCVLLYMGFNVYQLVEESRKSTHELSMVVEKVAHLKRENEKLRSENIPTTLKKFKNKIANSKLSQNEENNKTLLNELANAYIQVKELKKQLQLKESVPLHSLNYEVLSRRIFNQIREMWFLISSQVKRMKNIVPKPGYEDVLNFLDTYRELNQITERDFEELVSMDSVSEYKDSLALELSNIVQKRIFTLQNPKNCDTAKKLVCSLNKGCGYGCQMHHVLYCFIVAYSTGRTMIIDSSGWRYSSKGWDAYFESVTSCKDFQEAKEWGYDHASHQVVHLPIVDALFPRPSQMPQAVPKDLFDQIRMFHGHPFVWWIGQFCKFLFKYKPDLQREITEKKKSLGFKSPIVGVQIRRTDKINLEAAYHDIDEYMYWVDLYYKKLAISKPFDKKRVFIASDDTSVLIEAKKKYPEYEFLSDSGVSESAKVSRRYSDESLHGVISDIEILSDTDLLVCTFSSQVCRMAYEIMNSKHTDASQRFRSLDDIYYFGGQQEHKTRVIWPHTAKGRSELDLRVGDVIGIAGNHWNGQAKGLLHNLQKTGLFPAYKIEDIHDVEEFPIPKE